MKFFKFLHGALNVLKRFFGQSAEFVERVLSFRNRKKFCLKIFSAGLVITLLVFLIYPLVLYKGFSGFLSAKRAKLAVVSDKEDYEIFLNGNNTHFKTPHTFKNLSPGKYLLSLVGKDGKAVYEEDVSLLSGESKLISYGIESKPTGILKVDTKPEGQVVKISGVTVGTSPVSVRIKEGEYVVSAVSKSGNYLPVWKKVKVAAGKTDYVSFDLMPTGKIQEKKISFKNYRRNPVNGNFINVFGLERLYVSPFNPELQFLTLQFLFFHILFRSTDGGKTWKVVKSFPMLHTEQDFRVIFHHSNPKIIYVVSFTEFPIFSYNYAYSSALYKSSDCGETWNKKKVLDRFYAHRFVFVSNRDSLIYAVGTMEVPDGGSHVGYSEKNVLIVSKDGGKTWSVLSTLPRGFNIIDIAVSRENPSHIYATGSGKYLLIKSVDSGKTWFCLKRGKKDTYWTEIRLNPFNENEVYICQDVTKEDKDDENDYPDDTYTMLYSKNGGRSFQKLSLNKNDFVTDFTIPYEDKKQCDAYLIASKKIYIYSGGKLKKTISSDIFTKQDPYQIYLPNSLSKTIYLTTIGEYQGIPPSVWKLEDGQMKKIPLNEQSVGFFEANYLQFSDSGKLFAIAGRRDLVESDDYGKTWRTVFENKDNSDEKSFFKRKFPTLFVKGNDIYLLTSDKLYISRDSGKHFELLNSQKLLGSFDRVSMVYPGKEDNHIISYGKKVLLIYNKKGIIISDDGGKYFESVKTKKLGYVRDVILRKINGKLFIYLLSSKGLHYTSDKGAHWNKITKFVPYYLGSNEPAAMTVNPKTENLIMLTKSGNLYEISGDSVTYIGVFPLRQISQTIFPIKLISAPSSQTLYLISVDSGIFESPDLGKNWFEIRTGINSNYRVSSFAVFSSEGVRHIVFNSPAYGIFSGEEVLNEAH